MLWSLGNMLLCLLPDASLILRLVLTGVIEKGEIAHTHPLEHVLHTYIHTHSQ